MAGNRDARIAAARGAGECARAEEEVARCEEWETREELVTPIFEVCKAGGGGECEWYAADNRRGEVGGGYLREVWGGEEGTAFNVVSGGGKEGKILEGSRSSSGRLVKVKL